MPWQERLLPLGFLAPSAPSAPGAREEPGAAAALMGKSGVKYARAWHAESASWLAWVGRLAF